MRKTPEDFYCGNVVPCERQMVHGSEMAECMDDHDGGIREVTGHG